ncbi:MAG TPA: hypothetical protein VGD27_01935 [Longimicrobiales bacterium]
MPNDAIFQHTATFYSLIVGLAVANVLSAMANSAKSKARVRWYWMHTAATGMLLLIIAQDWWFLLSWDGTVRVSHPILVFLLARAGVLYFASNLLVPEAHDADDGVLDLRVHMLRVRRRFFGTLVAYAILDHTDTLLKGPERLAALGPYYPVYVILFVGMMLAATFVRTERVPGAVIVIMLVLHLTAIVGRVFGVTI